LCGQERIRSELESQQGLRSEKIREKNITKEKRIYLKAELWNTLSLVGIEKKPSGTQ
jgi:hypothetical protein